MKPFLHITAALGIAALLSGCFQVEQNAKLKADGSGTFELTMRMSKEAFEQVRAMGKGMAQGMGEEQEAPAEPEKFFDEPKLKEEAAKWGEGVRYVSGKDISDEKFLGYKVVYAFADITKLKVDDSPEPFGDEGMNPKGNPNPPFNFQFVKGNPSRLVIKVPEDAEPQAEEGRAQMDDNPMMQAMMRQMLAGMKMTLTIEIDGAIVNTNATHRDGNKITLMQIDMDKVLTDDALFKKFVKMSNEKPGSSEAAKKFYNTVPGCKVDMNKEIVIEFK